MFVQLHGLVHTDAQQISKEHFFFMMQSNMYIMYLKNLKCNCNFKLAITAVIFAILSSLSSTEKEFTFEKLKTFILIVLLFLIVRLLPPVDCYNVIPIPLMVDFF